MSLRLLINGARGRMGQMLIACAKEIPAVSLAAAVDVGDDFAAGIARSDAVIDFSHHSTCEAVLAACIAGKRTIVIGVLPEISCLFLNGQSLP